MADKNTIPLKTVWAREFQDTHFKRSVYPLLADLRFASLLVDGQVVKWSYDGDMTSGSLSDDDYFAVAGRTVTDESLTVNQKPYASFFIKNTDRIQDHRPTQEKWARKSHNVLIHKMDGYVLNLAVAGAASSLDAADFDGDSGDGIVVTPSNAASIFTAAQRILSNQNVIYDSTKVFKNNVKLDSVEKMPVAVIPAELREKLLLQIGFKDTSLGDDTLKQGYLGMIFGFNTVVSNSLPFSFRYTMSATPTNGKVLSIGDLDINWVTSIGSTAGNVLAETDATTSVGNLVDFLNDVYEATTSAKYVGFTRASLTIAQQRIADNISAVDGADGSCVITVAGQGRVVVSQDDTNGTIDREIVHAVFGTSQSVGMIVQNEPELSISAGDVITSSQAAGYLGKMYITHCLFGAKVFKGQTYQLIDVKIDASGYSAPNQVLY